MMMRRGSARAVLAKVILVLQPEPEETSVAHYSRDGQTTTAIARLWKPEDVPRCRLCEHCQLEGHPGARLCTVVVDGHVPEERAAMFSESGGTGPAGLRKAWRPIGPLDHPWWRNEA
jgi:hypothetical protein